MKVKNSLRKLDETNADLPQGSKIFVNACALTIVCFWSTSKKLHGKDRIFGWYVSNGSVKIKLQENSRPLYISQIEDFKKYFSEVDLHSF